MNEALDSSLSTAKQTFLSFFKYVLVESECGFGDSSLVWHVQSQEFRPKYPYHTQKHPKLKPQLPQDKTTNPLQTNDTFNIVLLLTSQIFKEFFITYKLGRF